MSHKFVITSMVAVAVVSSALAHAQSAVRLPPGDGMSATTKSDNFASPNGNTKTDSWNSQPTAAAAPNRFSKMFDAQAAEAGDPRRLPFYALMPLSRGNAQVATVGFESHPVIAANQPTVVKDVGALIGSLRTAD